MQELIGPSYSRKNVNDNHFISIKANVVTNYGFVIVVVCCVERVSPL
jgi:hypothetical protein